METEEMLNCNRNLFRFPVTWQIRTGLGKMAKANKGGSTRFRWSPFYVNVNVNVLLSLFLMLILIIIASFYF